MSKRIKKTIYMGMFCFLLLFLSVLYSNTFNDGRLVKQTDFSTYVFQIKDIPMILSVFFVNIYIWYVVIAMLILKFQKFLKYKNSAANYTRMLNPKLGLLGFLGFWAKTISPFIFFVFFGFFGFFFEGKMSNTLIDERFEINEKKADLKSFKIGFKLLFLTILAVSNIGMFSKNLELCAVFLAISLPIICAITLFLSKYLLYYYDNDNSNEE